MRSQRMILGIRSLDFVRNTEVVDRTNLPCVQDIIAKRRNSLFGHVVRLDDHTPAHRTLSHSEVAAARIGSRVGPGWRRRPGRPCHSWIQQIGDGTPVGIRAEWSKTRRRRHSGLTQRNSAFMMMMMMMIQPPLDDSNFHCLSSCHSRKSIHCHTATVSCHCHVMRYINVRYLLSYLLTYLLTYFVLNVPYNTN